ncbi:MAG: FAD-dependent thymidylate synthase [Candidatus Paceibacterota bacterium]
MRVEVCGYTVPVCDKFGCSFSPILSPEPVSAAFARISRSTKSVDELVCESVQDVESARKSNETIVFDYGHASIAEHAVFNVNVIGVSRLCTEFIESHRLASYTEKSQRYVKFENDFHVPEEIECFGSAVINKYCEIMEKHFNCYKKVSEGIDKKNKNAFEDVRYILPLATNTQLGMTVNAREAELMVRKGMVHRLAEVRSFADKLYLEIQKIAPSLIKARPMVDVDSLFSEFVKENGPIDGSADNAANMFIRESNDLIDSILYDEIIKQYLQSEVSNISIPTYGYIIDQLCEKLDPFTLPRFMELAEFDFMIYLSASAFAQIKRHRMGTLIPRPYLRDRGNIYEKFDVNNCVIPESLKWNQEYMGSMIACMQESVKFIYENNVPLCVAEYFVTNAMKRWVRYKINARSFGNFSRLRRDSHAQWEIRDLANQMFERVKMVAPITSKLYYPRECGDERS